MNPLKVTLSSLALCPLKRGYEPTTRRNLRGGLLATLTAMGLVFLNNQAVWASAVMATPKNGGFRMVFDYCKVNQLVGKKTRG